MIVNSIFRMNKWSLIGLLLCFVTWEGIAQESEKRLKMVLDRDGFSDHLDLVFRSGGDLAVNDKDALKIGEGYLVLAGLSANGKRMSIEERPEVYTGLEINLFVKGYSSGIYRLRIEGMDVTLKDKFMNTEQKINPENQVYYFKIDTGIKSSFGDRRFSLLFNPIPDSHDPELGRKVYVAYPNPFFQKLFLNIKLLKLHHFEVQIRDISGEAVWKKSFQSVEDDILALDLQFLRNGIYILDLTDAEHRSGIGSIKIIKQ